MTVEQLEEQKIQDIRGNPLKTMIVSYVSGINNIKEEEVTIGMVVDTFTNQFPQFLLAVAEENWFRGYEQGLDDSSALESL